MFIALVCIVCLGITVWGLCDERDELPPKGLMLFVFVFGLCCLVAFTVFNSWGYSAEYTQLKSGVVYVPRAVWEGRNGQYEAVLEGSDDSRRIFSLLDKPEVGKAYTVKGKPQHLAEFHP